MRLGDRWEMDVVQIDAAGFSISTVKHISRPANI
jgi:hypothetical protein